MTDREPPPSIEEQRERMRNALEAGIFTQDEYDAWEARVAAGSPD